MPNADAIIDCFKTLPDGDQNERFKAPGNYNVARSNPIIKIGSSRYFLPLTFVLAEAFYETPFYLMAKDLAYRNDLSKHRGDFSERVVANELRRVFGDSNVFTSVRAMASKKETKTDIDVLCLFGNQAVCVQVKSKKLTELARTGDDSALKSDFNLAVQEAYDQAILSKQSVLDRSIKLVDSAGKIIDASSVRDVHLLVVTTEIYPALTHQANTLLKVRGDEDRALVITSFDLDILAHYFNTPYDFIYYVRQRMKLMHVAHADEETAFIGYHLKEKLWKSPDVDKILIDPNYSSLVDRNLIPERNSLDVSEDTDPLANRWQNARFSQLCRMVAATGSPAAADIIFHLFDFSGSMRDSIVGGIDDLIQRTVLDGQDHSISVPPDAEYEPRVGITICTSRSGDEAHMRKFLYGTCATGKYRARANHWVALLFQIRNSGAALVGALSDKSPWVQNDLMDEHVRTNRPKLRTLNGSKIGRNEKCPCGSGRKFKVCCGP